MVKNKIKTRFMTFLFAEIYIIQSRNRSNILEQETWNSRLHL